MKFNASFILGGQIAGEAMRLFRINAEANFIEAGSDSNFLQTGDAFFERLKPQWLAGTLRVFHELPALAW